MIQEKVYLQKIFQPQKMKKRASLASLKALMLMSVIMPIPVAFSRQFIDRPGLWQSFGPIESKPGIQILLADPKNPHTIYAATSSSVYRSTDRGLTWSHTGFSSNGRSINTLIIANETLLAGTSGNGVYVSTNGGTTWTRAAPPMSDKAVHFLAYQNGRFYAGILGNMGMYFSDNGVDWMQANAPMQDKSVTSLISVSDKLYVGTEAGLFTSGDRGMNWTPAGIPLAGKAITTLLGFAGKIYVGTSQYGLFYSADSGTSWIRSNLDSVSISQLTGLDNTLYAVVDGQIFFSVNGGMSWAQAKVPDGQIRFKWVESSLISIDGIHLAGTREGVIRSADGGANWTRASPPIDREWVAAILETDKTLCAGTIMVDADIPGGGVFISTDAGTNWKPSNIGLTQNIETTHVVADLNFVTALGNLGFFHSFDAGLTWDEPAPAFRIEGAESLDLINGTLFLGTTSRLRYSFDGGRTWTAGPGGRVSDIVKADRKLFASLETGLYRSFDRLGTSWEKINNPLNSVATFLGIKLLWDEGILYASGDAVDERSFFKSQDDGTVWTEVPGGPRVDGRGFLISLNGIFYASGAGGLEYSRDKGNNWNRSNPPLSGKRVTELAFFGNTLYAGTLGNGLFFSSDSGLNWTQAAAPLANTNVNKLLDTANRLYAGTDAGVFWTSDGSNWFALNTDWGKVSVFDLSYLSFTNRLYAATSQGVYMQDLDTTPPLADSLIINNNATFTVSSNVSLILVAKDADSIAVSNDRFVNGARWEKYEVVRAKPFPLLPGDGIKTIYAKFKDISSNESKILNAQINLDTAPPSFSTHTAPPNATRGSVIMITQQVTEANLDRMFLRFRRTGEVWNNTIRSLDFVNGTAVIDTAWITNKGIDYQIIATDRANQSDTLRNGALDFFSLPVNVAASALGNSRSLPSGTGGAAYRMVSIPLDLPNAAQVKNVFKDLGKYGRRGKWRFYSYSGNGQWQEGENISMQTGGGYFMIRRDGNFLTNAISGTTTKTTEGVLGNISGWKLRGGDWTLIGNSYNTRIELSQLKLKRKGTLLSNHGVDVQVWSYDGKWKNPKIDPELALETWGGLFVRTNEADTIVFANKKEPYSRNVGKASITAANLAEGEWSVQIIAASSEFADEVNYFGVKKEAKDELDNLDWYEPPFLPDGIGLSFPHADWNDPAELTADFRAIASDGHRWEIAIRGESTHAVQLSFAHIETLPKDLQILLVDETAKIVRDLCQEANVAVRIPAEANFKMLTVLAGNEVFIGKNTEGMLRVPTTFALHQNYPNPFNPSTTIRYQLPAAGRVTLKIFDVMGREVMALEENKSREPGYYEMVADMSSLGSGMYFYHIAVTGEKDFQATKKMIFVK